jgi:hypothetical protein
MRVSPAMLNIPRVNSNAGSMREWGRRGLRLSSDWVPSRLRSASSGPQMAGRPLRRLSLVHQHGSRYRLLRPSSLRRTPWLRHCCRPLLRARRRRRLSGSSGRRITSRLYIRTHNTTSTIAARACEPHMRVMGTPRLHLSFLCIAQTRIMAHCSSDPNRALLGEGHAVRTCMKYTGYTTLTLTTTITAAQGTRTCSSQLQQ